MESETTAEQPRVPAMGFYAGVFLLLLLVSLDNFRSAWIAAAGHGWHLKFVISMPWAFCALTGTGLYMGMKRGDLGAKIAGPLLMNLGFIVMFAYEAMYKLGRIGH